MANERQTIVIALSIANGSGNLSFARSIFKLTGTELRSRMISS